MTRSKLVITIVFEYEVLTVEHRIRHEGMGVYIDEDETSVRDRLCIRYYMAKSLQPPKNRTPPIFVWGPFPQTSTPYSPRKMMMTYMNKIIHTCFRPLPFA